MSSDFIVNSTTVFDVVEKDGQKAERSLYIDVLALRQSYYLLNFDHFSWIPGGTNPADSLTKTVLKNHIPDLPDHVHQQV